MTTDKSIHEQINEAVEEERELRRRLGNGEITEEQEHRRIAQLEAELDQLWDLLRQRQGERDAGRDPNLAKERPVSEVEGYLQ